jgi:two-component system chemotaxis sensor kinase CheA
MDDELLCLFINESREHLVTIEADLLSMEEAGADVDIELVNKVFRAAHSIKGTSSFFGLNKVKELAHKAETVLDMLRSGTMTPNAEITNLLLAAFDRLREMINHSNESENEDIAELVTSLTDLAGSYLHREQKASIPQTVELTTEGDTLAVLPEKTLILAEVAPEVQPESEQVLEIKPQVHVAKASVSPKQPTTAVAVEDSIRVNVGVLERLMNLAGELVLGRNQLRASIAQKNSLALATADQRINQITAELQDVIMQTRLQPIGNVFGKFPRVVRDLAGSLGKEIELDIRGKDVALDKSLIESLSDPLTHMVRNAVDHGVELPEDRIRAGKKRQGTIIIDAHHEAGQVVVEIADDGQGIDAERIAQVAEAKGLIARDQLQKMSVHDKTALILLPGLSTAKKLTDVSGRGVGMDVVKTNLDRLGGKVEIVSVLGKGTTFRIKLPLTLAIIPSLIVSVENERFAIPQINVEELLRVQPGKTKTRIEIVSGTEVLVLRDRLIPLVRFANLVGVLPTYIDPSTGNRREMDRRERLADRRSPRHSEGAGEDAQKTEEPAVLPSPRGVGERRRSATSALEIAVVTTGMQTYGLVVGAFHDTEEIVVKPLGSHLKGLREYAGATILGDGTVALILDVAGLAAKAELGAVSGTERARKQSEAAEQDKLIDTHALLLFHNSPEQLCAVPLDTVLRIERIRPEQVETIGGRRTMQHRGGFLPLVTLSDTAQVNPIGDTKELAIMISNIRGHEVGLLGAMPVDVIETNAQIDQVTHRQKGVAGSAIIRNRTALVVDLFELVDATWPEWAAQRATEKPQSVGADGRVVLLAEDSDFFRSQLTRFLEEDGYTVLAAPDGEAAWDLLVENVNRVKMVVTDIEMPRLDGLGLTRRIRDDERTAGLPVIAVTSLASEDDFAKGKAVGVSEYQTKLDRDNLLAGLQRLMTTGHNELPASELAVPVEESKCLAVHK